MGASGSIKWKQFIGGAIPPGSRGPPSKGRIHAGSVDLHAALLIHFKPIAAGGMISLSLPLPFVTVIELIGMQCTVWEWVFP